MTICGVVGEKDTGAPIGTSSLPWAVHTFEMLSMTKTRVTSAYPALAEFSITSFHSFNPTLLKSIA